MRLKSSPVGGLNITVSRRVSRPAVLLVATYINAIDTRVRATLALHKMEEVAAADRTSGIKG